MSALPDAPATLRQASVVGAEPGAEGLALPARPLPGIGGFGRQEDNGGSMTSNCRPPFGISRATRYFQWMFDSTKSAASTAPPEATT